RDEALARFEPDAKHAAAAMQTFVGIVEEAVLLQAPAAQGSRAGFQHSGTRRRSIVESQLDFAFESRGHRDSLQRNGPPGPAKQRSNKDIHGEALERKGRKAEVTGQRHFEDLQILHDWDGVLPLGASPVVPELPERAAERSAE